ncbi:MAG: hypothetical protein GF416_05920 [Candidatus Altiarchaeales archaeon]|nr:hypothetical protein [Candidatus Altiarchaeales archaeon]MBD3416652.1 hypothetical protein [Candidatus Altiarchaeales archaeon]
MSFQRQLLVLVATLALLSAWAYTQSNSVDGIRWYYSEDSECGPGSDVSDGTFHDISVPFSLPKSKRSVCFAGIMEGVPADSLVVRVDDKVVRAYLNGEEVDTREARRGWRKISLDGGDRKAANTLVVKGQNIARNIDFEVGREQPHNIRWLVLGLTLAFIATSKELRKPWAMAAVIAVVVAAYMLPVIGRLGYWGISDWDQFYTFYQNARDTILGYGQIPFWNPYICGGNVHLAYPNTTFLSVFFLPVLLLGVPSGVMVSLFFYILAACLGCVLLSREMRLPPYSTLFFSITFALSGYFAHRMNQGHMPAMALAYIPFILWAYWKSQNEFRYAAAAGLFTALYVLEAHPFLITLMIMFLVAYPTAYSGIELAWFEINHRKRSRRRDIERVFKPLTTGIAVAVIAFLLVGFKALPTLHYAGDRPREVDDYGGADLMLLVEALASRPSEPKHPHRWGWHEYNVYIGGVAVLLSVYGMLKSLRQRRYAALLAVMLIMTLYSFNQSSPINLWSLFHNLPLFGSQHVPSRALGFVMFIFSVFAGLGMSRLERMSKHAALLVLAFTVFNLVSVNTCLLEGAFNQIPRIDYQESGVGFHHVKDVYNVYNLKSRSMYGYALAGVGVTNCYAHGGLNNRATPINAHDYRGEAYMEGGGTAEVVGFSPNRVDVRIESEADDILYLNMNHYPGWTANGRPAVERNGLVSAGVKAGVGVVEFSYTPPLFWEGVAATLAGVALALIVWKGLFRRVYESIKKMRYRLLPDRMHSWIKAVIIVLVLTFTLSIIQMIHKERAEEHAFVVEAVKHTSDSFDYWYKEGKAVKGWEDIELPYNEGDGYFRTYFTTNRKHVTLKLYADDCVEEVYYNGREQFYTRQCSRCEHCNSPLRVSFDVDGGMDSHVLAVKTRDRGGIQTYFYLEYEPEGSYWSSLALLSAAGAAAIFYLSRRIEDFRKSKPGYRKLLFLLMFCLLVFSAYMKYPLVSQPEVYDLRMIYYFSRDLSNGENPYRMMENTSLSHVGGHPSYMPLVYITGAGISKLGSSLEEWSYLMRLLSLVCDLGVAFLIFKAAMGRGNPLLGLFGAAFWSFNRFSLIVLKDGHWDIITLFFLVWSIHLMERRPKIACLLLGAAISIKQFPVVLAPVYVLMLRERLGFVKSSALVLAVPLLVSTPFLMWNSTAFTKAIGQTAVRPNSGVSMRFSDSPLLDFTGDSGMLSRAPLIILYAILYALVHMGWVRPYSAALISFTLFLSYNPYIYGRYFTWIMPFLPLTLLEVFERKTLASIEECGGRPPGKRP